MLSLEGYSLTRKIHENRKSIVYRGIRRLDGVPVAVKWYNSVDNFDRNLRILKNELDIMVLVASAGVVKVYDIITTRDGCGLVMEDFGGESLRETTAERKIDLDVFLNMGITLCDTLARVHQKDVIHKDINPGNIIVNPDDWTVKLADFGISSLLSRDVQNIVSPERLEGTLAYISPEQTGRMNRSIDYRTDIYSLGMTFYEILAGQSPFQGMDAVGWVHNHIALSPAPPHEVDAAVPRALSYIVLKMLEKNAEDRYQNALGIKADLEECLRLLQDRKSLEVFEPGLHDVSTVFHIPQKLYGREREVETLLKNFDGAMELGNSEILLVAGYSGVGKSALVKEIHKPIMKRRGYFCSGKFDQFKRNIPYSAIIQAFRELLLQILSESDESLIEWKRKLLEALGANAQVIIDMIPDLELVMGKQASVINLPSVEAQVRFNVTFQKFIKVFTRKAHPLVLFLDDLQWADFATLTLLKVLMTDPAGSYLFLIGAYRDNEVSAGHPFVTMLEDLQSVGVIVHKLTLKPLELDDLNQLVSESLVTDEESARPLTNLVLEKTAGNPFFVNEFLGMLVHDELLRFDLDSRSWIFNAEEILAQGITNNVVELMIGRMQKLPEATQKALQLASCIGNVFDLGTLSVVSENSIRDTARALWPAIQGGLLTPVGEIRELLNASGEVIDGLDGEDALKVMEKFPHDRVQQAAYAMIDGSRKSQIHLKIGRLLLAKLEGDELEEMLFELVGHLNHGRALILDESERLELIRLNLRAGKKAKASAAFQPALSFLTIGRELLPENGWLKLYGLTSRTYLELGEAAYMTADFELLDQIAEVVDKNATNVLDKVRIHEMKMNAYFGRGMLVEAVGFGLAGLRLLGIKFPKKTRLPHVLLGLLKIRIKLLGKTPESIEQLPEMTDPGILLGMRFFSPLIAMTYFLKNPVYALFGLAGVQLSLKYGNGPDSPIAYGAYGLVQAAILAEFDVGYRFGRLGLKLAERPLAKEKLSSTRSLVNLSTTHLKESIRGILQSESSYVNNYHLGMEMGKLQDAALALMNHSYSAIYCGLELGDLAEELKSHVELCKQHRQKTMQTQIEAGLQTVLNLLGRSEDPVILRGEAFNEDNIPAILEMRDESSVGFTYMYKTQLAYLFGEYEQALEIAELVHEKYMEVSQGMAHHPVFYTFYSLIYLALLPEEAGAGQKRFYKNIAANQKKMKRWASHGPNYLHKYDLVEAELARVRGKDSVAMEFYLKAIAGARKNHFTQDEALANELFAKYWLARDVIDYAKLHMTEARRLYIRWGAAAKVQQVETNFPRLLTKERELLRSNRSLSTMTATLTETNTAFSGPILDTLPAQGTVSGSITTRSTGGGAIDLNTVVKATRAMAGEIKLQRLLGTMMEIVMENAGARSGYLILKSEDGLLVEAVGNLETKEVSVLQSLPLDSCPGLSGAIVQYAARTKESVVLNDASNAGPFTADPHIAASKPKSVLCVPIVNQGNLSGILYLENNLSTGAFTLERLELLNMLSSQIAVSIDNARLYANLESKVQERTSELRDSLEQVQALKDKQDGDYFLTSILINPLARNEARSKRVTIDFLVTQKKQFHFKKWDDELGGDICIAHSVTLENRPHTVFLNADAMGKSMQGAGGALVLGAVFQSIIERTRLTSFNESQLVETWIQAAFNELQKVFESFKGRMLISLVLGAVTDETGELKMINAEHPWTVLFREGRASFIEDTFSLHKLGAQRQNESVHIYRAQLIAGDVVIAGSDGRDDIWLSLMENGERVMNSEETEFLKRVEEGAGKLPKIKTALLRQGELTDDLSLLRLEFK